MGIRRPSDLATTKAFYQVDDVDLLRANTDNTWPVTARYYQELAVSKGNILLDVGGSSNITLSMPYHFDLGPNIFWTENNLNGQVNASDFARKPDPANTAIITNAYGRGSFTANIELRQPDSNLDVFTVNVYSNSDLIENTGTIRKTSKGNFDLVFYTGIPTNEYTTVGYRQIQLRVPYEVKISVLCIGGGGGGGAYSYSTGGAGAGLSYYNNYTVPANSLIYVNVGKPGGKGPIYANTSREGTAGGASEVRIVPPSGGSVYLAQAGLGAGGRDGDSGGFITSSGFGYPSGFGYQYQYVYGSGPLGGGNAYDGGNGGAGGTSYYKIQGPPQTPAFQGGNGGGAGGYTGGANYSAVGNGRTSGLFAMTDWNVTQYDTFNTSFWLSSVGGGASGLARVSSISDTNSYQGYGTGIYGWNGYNQRSDWENNYNVGVTYPKTVGLPEEKKYGGYGAILEGSMDPLFKTTTPNFGAGGAINGDGGPGVVRIMFDGDKRKFPNTNCGLEVQTASWVWKDGVISNYSGTVTDPDNLYPNVLSWIEYVF